MKALRYNTISRITKTHQFNKQNILTISSGLRNLGLTYNNTKSILKSRKIMLNNKSQANIIKNEPQILIKILSIKNYDF